MQVVGDPAHSLHEELQSAFICTPTFTNIVIGPLARWTFSETGRPLFKWKMAKSVTGRTVVRGVKAGETLLVTG